MRTNFWVPSIVKFLFVVTFVSLLGLPILKYHFVLMLLGMIVACFYAEGFRISGHKLIFTSIALSLLTLLGFFGPRIKIEEGHNVYLPEINAEFMPYDLPSFIKTELHNEFETKYPASGRCTKDEMGCWVTLSRKGPTWAFSLDSFWQSPKYSRIVSTIDITDQEKSRFGFVNNGHSYSQYSNHGHYDWWHIPGNLARTDMPYFVVYEIPADLVDSKLSVQGKAFIEDAGNFTRINGGELAIQENMIGKRIWGINISERLSLRLEESTKVRFLNLIYKVLATIVFLFSLILLKVRFRHLAYLVGFYVVIVLFSKLVMPLRQFELDNFMWPRTDGLTHKSFGRILTDYLLQGNFREFFLGIETVFYFMPGLRYFRSFEAAFFGETDLMRLVYLMCFLFSLWKVICLYIRNGWAHFMFLSFLLLGTAHELVEGLTFKTFYNYSKYGFAETLGYFFFLGGFYLLLRSLESFSKKQIFFANILMAFSVFNRPNCLIVIGLILIYTSFIALKEKKFHYFLCLILGFTPFLFMPFHNWYFGNTFVLMTSASNVEANLFMRPMDYFAGLLGLFSNGLQDPLWLKLKTQIVEWASTFRWILLLFVLINFRKFRLLKDQMLLLAIVGSQIPLFFWHPAGRYAALAWILTTIASLKVIIESGLYNRATKSLSAFGRRSPALRQ